MADQILALFATANADGSRNDFSSPFDVSVNTSAAGDFILTTTTPGFFDEVNVFGLDDTDPLTAYASRVRLTRLQYEELTEKFPMSDSEVLEHIILLRRQTPFVPSD